MIRFFAGHPTAANLLMVLLLAVGVGTGVLGVNLAIAAFLGKMCAAGAFQLVTLIPAQDFPDHLRSTGLGISSTVARLAIILVPSLVLVLEDIKGLARRLVGRR